jgi:Spy/CpxP family protein refolding chaperone
MTTKTKTSLILLSTLVMGVVVGAVASGLLRDQRQQDIQRMPPHHRFMSFMRDVIRPSGEQSPAIDGILDSRSRQLSALNEKHENEVFAVFDSMRTELAAILTDEQRARLETNLSKGFERGYERRVAELKDFLQLSQDQVTQIEKIMGSMRGPRPHPQNFEEPPGRPRRGMRMRWGKMQEDIEAVLTPEQQAKYREMRRRRDSGFGPPFGRPGRGPRGPRMDGAR